MNGEYIPVVWGVDEKYVLQAFVVMHSILKHSDKKYRFYIITADDITKQAEEYTACLKSHYDSFSICIKKVQAELFEQAEIRNQHLSVAAYFRLFIPDLLLECDKCIYLDCDVLVNGELEELFQIDIEDDYIAGVKDCHIIEDTPKEKEHEKILGLAERDRYVNSGVLLMNLHKMREDRISEKFSIQMGRENWYEDQDVLNVCCYPHIRTLPLKYNLFHFYYGKTIKCLYKLSYTKEDFDFKEPLIVHTGAIWKPWKDRRVKCAEVWWKLAAIFQNTEWYARYEKNSWYDQEKEDKQLLACMNKEKDKQVVVCGYTDTGKGLCDLLYTNGYFNIAAILDNDKGKWGQLYRGIPVMGIEQIICGYDDLFWIISNQAAFEEIRKQIKGYGFHDKDIERYVNYHCVRLYLLCLDPKYYDSELDRIAGLEYAKKYENESQRKAHLMEILENPEKWNREYNYLKDRYHFDVWYHI